MLYVMLKDIFLDEGGRKEGEQLGMSIIGRTSALNFLQDPSFYKYCFIENI